MLLEKLFLSVFTWKLKIWCQRTRRGQENLERVFYIGCKVATGFGSFDAKLKIRVGVYSKQQRARKNWFFLSYFVNFLKFTVALVQWENKTSGVDKNGMCVILLVRKSMKFELVLLLATPRVPEKCRWSQLLHIFCNSIREWEERELYFNPFHRNHAPSPHIFLFFPHSELPPKYMREIP